MDDGPLIHVVITVSSGGERPEYGTGSWRPSLAAAHDATVQMIDTSIVRVHQHAACVARNRSQSMGRSQGGLTSKIHAVVDTNGLPVRLGLTAGEAHDNRLALKSFISARSGSMLLADRGYDADWIRALPPKGVLGPTFRPDPTEESRSASAHTFIRPKSSRASLQ